MTSTTGAEALAIIRCTSMSGMEQMPMPGGCCGGLMATLLVAGVMDVRSMAVGTAAITLERLTPRGERAAHAIGALIVRAASLG